LEALCVERASDNCILVQLGKTDVFLQHIEAGCVLPGSKQQTDEVPADAAARVLKTKVPVKNVRMARAEREVVSRPSPKYAIMTKYFKTVFTAVFEGNSQEPAVNVAPSEVSVDLDSDAQETRPPIVVHSDEDLPVCDLDVNSCYSTESTRCAKLPKLPSGFELPVHDLLCSFDKHQKATLFAWIPLADFDFLKDGKADLQEWIRNLPSHLQSKLFKL